MEELIVYNPKTRDLLKSTHSNT